MKNNMCLICQSIHLSIIGSLKNHIVQCAKSSPFLGANQAVAAARLSGSGRKVRSSHLSSMHCNTAQIGLCRQNLCASSECQRLIAQEQGGSCAIMWIFFYVDCLLNKDAGWVIITVAGGRLEVAYRPKHDWHRYATAQHVKLYWETQCNSRKRQYNNETKVTWMHSLQSRCKMFGSLKSYWWQ